ncbi:MAG: FkbM family methyltransferase [Cyanobacteria bacterium P01_G01_bin.54]
MTYDEGIYQMVVEKNEYQLPECFAAEDIIVDCGAHIGAFAYAALIRGSQWVFSYEAERQNFDLATQFLNTYIERGDLKLNFATIWRSDQYEDQFSQTGYPLSLGGINTGGFSVAWKILQSSARLATPYKASTPAPTLAFDVLVSKITNNGQKRIRLLKLDCEGSEWPILITSRKLHLIDEICGEFHEINGEHDTYQPSFFIDGFDCYTVEQLVTHLETEGFTVDYSYHQAFHGVQPLGLFWAYRDRDKVN